MSFLSKLIIDGEELTLLNCHFGFSQGTDYTGRPSEIPKGGQLELIIEGTARTDFLEWMITPSMTKDGSITFYRRDSMANLKRIEFTDAYCINYDEYFDADGTDPLSISIVLSAKELTIKGTKFKNKWHVK